MPRFSGPAAAMAVLMAAASACGSASHQTSPPTTAPSVETLPARVATTVTARSTTTTTTTRPRPITTVPQPTTTLPPAAGLPAPAPLVGLVTPAPSREGVWQPAGVEVGGRSAIYVTQMRAAAGVSPAGMAWMDPHLGRLSLYAGIGEPQGVWAQQGAVGTSAQLGLIAAFNSGFKIYSYRTGWYDQGRTAMSLVAGMASLVIYADGTATVGEWGRDVSLSPGVVAVRQNLPLLVDHGTVNPSAADPAAWGAVLGGRIHTWRSGIGVTASGALVYAAGPGLDPQELASLLVAARTVRAMELDINPQWVSFVTYAHAGGVGTAVLGGIDLVPGMFYGPSHYLSGSSRDFLAFFARA